MLSFGTSWVVMYEQLVHLFIMTLICFELIVFSERSRSDLHRGHFIFFSFKYNKIVFMLDIKTHF